MNVYANGIIIIIIIPRWEVGVIIGTPHEEKKRNIHLLSIVCIDEGAVYDITVEKKHFATTLEENLVHYVREEKYEECQKIADMISELKGKQLSELIYSVSGSK